MTEYAYRRIKQQFPGRPKTNLDWESRTDRLRRKLLRKMEGVPYV